MIKANELRIGNLVLWYNSVDVVYGIEDGSLWINIGNDDQADIKIIEPIPLTQEWLLKFGFEEKFIPGMDENYAELFYNYFTADIDGFELGWDNESREVDLAYNGSTLSLQFPHIKYVHQLQNIYFALTGEELILNQLAEKEK